MTRVIRVSLVLAIFSSFFLLADSAMSQEYSGQIEEVVVTATKREASAQDVAVAVAAVSERTLEMMGDINVDSLADIVPGMEIANNGPGNNQVTMRGVGTLGGGFQTVSSVGYYLDETPMSAFAALPEIGLYDVSRVEILRGPQGTLFGDGSMGGTIRVVTNKPDAQAFYGEVIGGISDTRKGGSNYSLRGRVNIPLVEDVLAMRAVVGYRKDGGWIDVPSLSASNVNDSEIFDARVALRWTPNDNATIDFTYFRNQIDIEGDFAETGVRGLFDPRSIQPFAGDPTEIGIEKSDYDLFNLTIDYDFGFASLVSATSYFDFNSEFILGLSEFAPLFFGPGGAGGVIRQVAPDTSQEAFTQELRLVSNSDGNFRWTVGGFYKDVDRLGFEDFQITLPLFGIIGDSSLSSLDFGSKSYALFAEVEYDFTDTVTAFAGGRYFDTERSYVTQPLVGSLIFGGDPTVINPVNESSDDHFSPRAGIKWQASDAVLVFASISEGFRAGGVNTNARDASDPTVPPGDSRLGIPKGFAPETIQAYEAGIKTNPSDTLQLNAYVYMNDWKDLHLGDATPDGLYGFTTNAGKAESKGLEVELLALPTEGLLLGLNAAYTDAKINDDVFDAIGRLTAQGGNRIPFVPKFTINATLDYTFPINDTWTGIAFGSYTYRSSTYSDAANTPEEKNESMNRVNVRVGAESGRFGVYLFANNLLDEKATTLRNNVVEAVPMVYQSFIRPRTIGIEVKANF